ncbi:MAG: hypothetical protein H0W22_08340 [Chloroflexi bacterium]|nr:hypothetical protein [Chloroflexota bacterium]
MPLRFLAVVVPALVVGLIGCGPSLGTSSPGPANAEMTASAVPPASDTLPVLSIEPGAGVIPVVGPTAFSTAQFALMEVTGSNCVSSREGELDVSRIEFDGIGPEGGVLKDGRGWVGSIGDARQHFGAETFVAEDKVEHWFITRDPATLNLLFAAKGPAVAALIPIPLSDGRTAWYLGPRSFSAC